MKIKVLSENNELYIESHQEQKLLEVLQKNNISVLNFCHGNGTCGKCKIKVLLGSLPVTEVDRRMLSEEELEQGVRLACKASIENAHGINGEAALSIEVIGKSEEEISIEGIKTDIKRKQRSTDTENYFIAIDIGTTTIAMALVDEKTGEVCDTYTSINHQRKYGADVISRIVAVNDGKAEELKKIIEEDLCRGIGALSGIEYEINSGFEERKSDKYILERKINLNKIIIAGNTTMIHLLMGYSCESLGKYPFVSEHLEKIECKWNNIPVTIFPGISAFVGGDIVAGILACDNFKTEELCLLLDLGTNGEIVLGNKHKILTTSTAAGPAFEGGNITCGMASIPGSICQVKIQNQRAVVRTIKNEMPPNGICGTGLISVMAQLKRNQIVNEEGELKQPYDKNGFPLWIFENGEKIALYQKDVREFQMAKAALRAGIEILIEEYGCILTDVEKVFIAGGFGKAINIEDIVAIGMMPDEFKDKVNVMGNSALQGAVCFGKDIMARKQIENICHRADNIMLSENPEFQKKYLKYMEL